MFLRVSGVTVSSRQVPSTSIRQPGTAARDRTGGRPTARPASDSGRTQSEAFPLTSADGTRIRAWRNRGRAEAMPVIISNGLGTPPAVWPSLAAARNRYRVASWHYRGTAGGTSCPRNTPTNLSASSASWCGAPTWRMAAAGAGPTCRPDRPVRKPSGGRARHSLTESQWADFASA